MYRILRLTSDLNVRTVYPKGQLDPSTWVRYKSGIKNN